MNKWILCLAMIMGINFVQAQNEIDTSDSFIKLVNEAAKSFKPIKIYTGNNQSDHSASIGQLANIFNNTGKAFWTIFSTLDTAFPGVVYANDMSVPHIPIAVYYHRFIKDHSYDSLAYSSQTPKYITQDGKLKYVEREIINCYDVNKKRVRFIQITRYNKEIIHVLDNGEELVQMKE